MLSYNFKYKEFNLYYSLSGSDAKVLLMFHGFGQTKEAFNPLIEVLKDQYTIYSFDLFFHGQSDIHSQQKILHKSTLVELIAAFMAEKGIENFSTAGYSLGAKFSLVLAEAFPEKIQRLILIAPDGIKINFWYSFATALAIPRRIFRSTIDTPSSFNYTASILEKLKLLDKSMIKFARTQMNTREKRHQVYHSWVGFRYLRVDIRKLARTIGEKNIETELFIGKYDKMITKKVVSSFVKDCSTVIYRELEAGHTNLIQKVAEFYQSNLNK
jgi:pimeloyl-ACP methyl ester carboxylesterase